MKIHVGLLGWWWLKTKRMETTTAVAVIAERTNVDALPLLDGHRPTALEEPLD